MGPLTADLMRQALHRLDELLVERKCDPVTLIVGGGGAMILAHGFPLGTTDIDAVPTGMELADLDLLVKQIAAEHKLAPDWLNPYFATFAHVLPEDYGDRLVDILNGQRLRARALGRDEMLIMKCFAHRQKDVGHAKALIRGGARVKFAEAQIDALAAKRIPGTEAALDFLQDVLEQLEPS